MRCAPHLLFGCARQRRVSTGALVFEPVLPVERMIRPLLHLDTPGGRFRIEKGGLTSRARKATGDSLLGVVDENLHAREQVPQSRRLVVRRSHHAPPIRTERGAAHLIVMALKHTDLAARLHVPEPCCLVVGSRHYPPPIRAEGSAIHDTVLK